MLEQGGGLYRLGPAAAACAVQFCSSGLGIIVDVQMGWRIFASSSSTLTSLHDAVLIEVSEEILRAANCLPKALLA